MTLAIPSAWYRRADNWQYLFFLLILASANLSIAVSQISLGLSLAIMLTRALTKREFPPRTGLEKPAIALALWALIMIPFSHDPPQSVIFYRRFYLFFALWIGTSLATSENRRYGMLVATIFGAFVVSMVCEIQIIKSAGGLFTSRFMGASNSMTSGVLLMMAVIVGLGFLAIQGFRRRWRVLLTVAVSLIGLAMFQTMTRSAIVGLVAGVGVMILLVRPRLFLIFVMLGVLAAGVVFTYGDSILPDRLWHRISPDTLLNTTSGFGPRVEMWQGGWLMIQDQPLTGVGDCDLTAIGPLYYGDQSTTYFGHMHSNPIMLAVIWGIPGLLLSHWFILLPLILLVRRWRSLAKDSAGRPHSPAQAAWILAAIGVLVGFYVSGFSEWYFGDAEAMSLYLAVIGIGLGRNAKSLAATEDHG